MRDRLPLWRLISGIAVLGCLLLAGVAIAPLYIEDYRFTHYVKDLAVQPATASIPDDRLRRQISTQAKLMGLPVEIEDVTVLRRTDNRVQLQVARFKAQLLHADLHFPAIATK